jgi:two-component system, cell cycle response regulator DivK
MSPLRILLIDDEPDIRSLVTMILEGTGHTIIEAGDGKSGLELLASERPDVVLLDLRMPVIDGWEFMRRVRAGNLAEGTKIIGVSAHASPESIKEAKDAGCDAYVSKPFTMDDLLRTIEATENDNES